MKTQSLHNQLVDWRHDLHMNPQISFEEEYASNKVANLLKDFGIEVHQGIAKTGVVGVLKKGNSNKSINPPGPKRRQNINPPTLRPEAIVHHPFLQTSYPLPTINTHTTSIASTSASRHPQGVT